MSKGRSKYYMKLQKLIVNKLHDAYNYNVTFNSDITFLYGTNGCGKTTILNITEAIITGMLFKLFDYAFESISLQYCNTKKCEEVYEITIKRPSKRTLYIDFDGNKSEIEFIRADNDQRRGGDFEEIAKRYFDEYSILREIRKSFNYVYLPLNRSMNLRNSADLYEDELNYMRYTRQFRYRFHDNMDSDFSYSSRDLNIIQIEELIYRNYNYANSEIRNIENNFRNQVLQSLLEVDANSSTEELVSVLLESQALKISPSKITEVKNQYISILRELTSTDVDIENCETFFKLLRKDVQPQKDVDITSWFRYKEFNRIQRTISLAEKTRKAKEKVMSNFQLFIDTMNSFISQTEEHKEFIISPDGRIGFITAFSKDIISVHHLSSGEKQLLIFFANLIFNVSKRQTGIFVVDEPELSLHLSWQKIFVEKTMSINPNMQLIFATHSPEFVGKNRNKMFKLEKIYG